MERLQMPRQVGSQAYVCLKQELSLFPWQEGLGPKSPCGPLYKDMSHGGGVSMEKVTALAILRTLGSDDSTAQGVRTYLLYIWLQRAIKRP